MILYYIFYMGNIHDHRNYSGWKTIGELRAAYGKDYYNVKRRVKLLQAKLTEDLQAAGYSEDEAPQLVDEHLIGTRRHLSGGRKWVLMVSPDAERLLGFDQSGPTDHENPLRDPPPRGRGR